MLAQDTVLEASSCSAVRSYHSRVNFTQLPAAVPVSWGAITEVSSLFCDTQLEQCYSCISSWYSTFFNIILPQFLSRGGPCVAFHKGVLLGSVALWLLAFPFTMGMSYSCHLLPVLSPWCQPISSRTATELLAYCSLCSFASREVATTTLLIQLNSCSTGNSLKSPRAILIPPEQCKREEKSKVLKAKLTEPPWINFVSTNWNYTAAMCQCSLHSSLFLLLGLTALSCNLPH